MATSFTIPHVDDQGRPLAMPRGEASFKKFLKSRLISDLLNDDVPSILMLGHVATNAGRPKGSTAKTQKKRKDKQARRKSTLERKKRKRRTVHDEEHEEPADTGVQCCGLCTIEGHKIGTCKSIVWPHTIINGLLDEEVLTPPPRKKKKKKKRAVSKTNPAVSKTNPALDGDGSIITGQRKSRRFVQRGGGPEAGGKCPICQTLVTSTHLRHSAPFKCCKCELTIHGECQDSVAMSSAGSICDRCSGIGDGG